jgi:hypothetical protein
VVLEHLHCSGDVTCGGEPPAREREVQLVDRERLERAAAQELQQVHSVACAAVAEQVERGFGVVGELLAEPDCRVEGVHADPAAETGCGDTIKSYETGRAQPSAKVLAASRSSLASVWTSCSAATTTRSWTTWTP